MRLGLLMRRMALDWTLSTRLKAPGFEARSSALLQALLRRLQLKSAWRRTRVHARLLDRRMLREADTRRKLDKVTRRQLEVREGSEELIMRLRKHNQVYHYLQ